MTSWPLQELDTDEALARAVSLAVSELNDRLRLARSRGLALQIDVEKVGVSPSGAELAPISVKLWRCLE